MLTVTADNLPRVMQCSGSLYMNPTPLPETPNVVRQEGIAAHWLIEQCYVNGEVPATYVDRQALNGVIISGNMAEDVADYLADRHASDKVEVAGSIGDGKTWQVNCRADRQKLIDDTLYIDEFKYGYSPVEAEMNWTLLAHAFRYVLNNRAPYPMKFVFTVYQPRGFHGKGKIRKWPVSFDELQRLYGVLQARLSNPENILQTGSACKNCPAMHTCPAAIKAGMNAVDVAHVAYTEEISNTDLSNLLDTLKRGYDMLKQTGKAFEELAKHRVQKGEIVPNYGLERELTNRKWHDHVTPEFALSITGLDLTKKALVTPAQAEKMGVNPVVMKMLADRHESGQKLVRVDDSAKAKKLFNQPKGN